MFFRHIYSELIQNFLDLPPHLLLCSYPLGVGSFFVTLHADGVELHYTLCQRDEVQDVSKWLQECRGWGGNRKAVSQYHWMDWGVITLQGQNGHIMVCNNEHIDLSVVMLLMQIVYAHSWRNASCLAHSVVSMPTVKLYLPLQHEPVSGWHHHTKMWRQTRILTFLWKVPSKAAIMTVFPKLAISSQNSTVSGNYNNTKEAQI